MVRPLASPAMSVSKDRYRHIHPGLSVAITVLAAILLAGCSTQSHDSPSSGNSEIRRPSGDSQPATTRAEESTATPHQDSAPELYNPGPMTPAAASVLQAAQRFAAAWAQPNLTAAQWWSGVAPLCESGLAQRLRTTDPGTVSATRVTGVPKVTTSRGDQATFETPTDAGTLVTTLINVDGAWLVGDIDFRRNVQ